MAGIFSGDVLGDTVALIPTQERPSAGMSPEVWARIERSTEFLRTASDDELRRVIALWDDYDRRNAAARDAGALWTVGGAAGGYWLGGSLASALGGKKARGTGAVLGAVAGGLAAAFGHALSGLRY